MKWCCSEFERTFYEPYLLVSFQKYAYLQRRDHHSEFWKCIERFRLVFFECAMMLTGIKYLADLTAALLEQLSECGHLDGWVFVLFLLFVFLALWYSLGLQLVLVTFRMYRRMYGTFRSLWAGTVSPHLHILEGTLELWCCSTGANATRNVSHVQKVLASQQMTSLTVWSDMSCTIIDSTNKIHWLFCTAGRSTTRCFWDSRVTAATSYRSSQQV